MRVGNAKVKQITPELLPGDIVSMFPDWPLIQIPTAKQYAMNKDIIGRYNHDFAQARIDDTFDNTHLVQPESK